MQLWQLPYWSVRHDYDDHDDDHSDHYDDHDDDHGDHYDDYDDDQDNHDDQKEERKILLTRKGERLEMQLWH